MSLTRRLAQVDWILHGLLALLIILPAYAVMWWGEGGGVSLVLYRQPKEAAIAVLGWLFLAAFFWRRNGASEAGGTLPSGTSEAGGTFLGRRRDSVSDSGSTYLGTALQLTARALRRVEIRLLAVFLGWMVLTIVWAHVPANGLVELRQYLPLFFLLLVLTGWQERQPAVARTIRLALVLGFAGLTAVGLLQLIVSLPWLHPINPTIGALNPSFMGYKNPMALALLGQIFLLAEMAFSQPRSDAKPWPGGPWIWRLLLMAELLYLATLGSRTSLFALAVATVYLVSLGWVAGAAQARRKGVPFVVEARRLFWVGALVAVFLAALALHPIGRAKATSVLGFVSQPAKYLDSDRGVYFRNTLEMVRHNPWGVGLGDWQTHYPVYRLHGRGVAFDGRHQVRRAHSDPVQILGEGGWPALLLWLALLGWLILSTGRQGAQGDHAALFLSAQVVALSVAMSFDYLLDLPYGKLQFFLLLALVIGRPRPFEAKHQTDDRLTQPTGSDRLTQKVLAAVFVLVLVVSVVSHARLLRRTVAAAAIQQGYQHWVAQGDAALSLLKRRVDKHGPELLASRAMTKTTHRDFLVLAHAAALLGHRPESIRWTQRTLELHPYYLPAYELMANLTDDPAVAEDWRAAHRHIRDEARHGYEHPVPPSLTHGSVRAESQH